MIQPVTLGDLWTLRRKPRSQVWLYNEAMLAHPHRQFTFALRCLLEGGRDGATFVYRERGMRAVAQAVGRSGRPEHDIVMLSAYGGGSGQPTDPDVWFRLIEALCLHAGQYRVQRLYAALSQRHEELREIFRQLGFASYTQQIVLRLEGPDWDQGVTVAPMRAQARRHDWAIHRLYGLTAPHLVQQAEARVARDWQLPITEGWRRAPRRGWVLGTDDSPIAALRLMSGPAAHVFTLLINPTARCRHRCTAFRPGPDCRYAAGHFVAARVPERAARACQRSGLPADWRTGAAVQTNHRGSSAIEPAPGARAAARATWPDPDDLLARRGCEVI
ncbi:MAG: hypothetical protein U0Z44_12525 [Kouleothrix sp.]